MAAAIVPVVATILPAVLPQLVRWIDKLFGNKTGAVKMQAATEAATAIITQLQKVVGPSVGLPGAGEIPGIIQSIVDGLNRAGELKGAATEIAPEAATAWTGAMDGVSKMLEGALMVLKSAKGGQ